MGAAGEAGQRDVSDVLPVDLLQPGLDRGDLDVRPLDLENATLPTLAIDDGHLDGGPWRSFDPRGRLGRRDPGYRLTLDRHDQIADGDAGALRRGVREDLGDEQAALGLGDAEADP